MTLFVFLQIIDCPW